MGRVSGGERASLALESLIRRRQFRLIEGRSPDPQADLSVRVASTRCDWAAADELVSTRYAWRGYGCDSSACPARRESGDEGSPTYFTLLASRGSNTVGTVTLGVDQGKGLLVDHANWETVNQLRKVGRRVAELIRLAIKDDVDPKAVLAELFSAAYAIGRVIHQATDALIEVNPRHVAFYERIFGFARESVERVCPRVNAPAVLLRLDLASLDQKLSMPMMFEVAAEAAAA